MTRIVTVLAATCLVAITLLPNPASAQTLHVDIAESIAEKGWWDETGNLDDAAMRALVDEYGGEIGFGYSDRSFDVPTDPNLDAADLLAQAALDQLSRMDTNVSTVLLVTGGGGGGASQPFGFAEVVAALSLFDGVEDSVVDGFDKVASQLVDPDPSIIVQPVGEVDATPASSVTERGVFTLERILLLVAIALGIAVLYTARSKRRSGRRAVTTAPAKADTSAQLTAMSDLILDLEPRITIADDADLKRRFTEASRTYSEVRERARDASAGHEVADLRLEIAEARWQLDVIDAELDGRPAPSQPNTRDTSGSAWDSTRGTGADR